MSPPVCVILGGPNGSGKTTVATSLLRDGFGIRHYVNADVLAQGLSGFSVEDVAFAASELMLERADQLVQRRESFSFETTLAGRSLARTIRQWKQAGYRVCLVYLWLRNADLNVQRVQERVRRGGHSIPEETIRRRYERSLANFFQIYRTQLDAWIFNENAEWSDLREIARFHGGSELMADEAVWNRLIKEYASKNDE